MKDLDMEERVILLSIAIGADPYEVCKLLNKVVTKGKKFVVVEEEIEVRENDTQNSGGEKVLNSS
jgi:hypothetical protein